MSKTVLLVDKDSSFLIGLSGLFSKAGYQVRSAASRQDALRILDAERVDVLLTGLEMQEGEGADLLRSAKEYDPCLPLILFQEGGEAVSLDELYSLGAMAVLPKDFERRQALQVVQRSLGAGFSFPEAGDGVLALEASLEEVHLGRGGFQVDFNPALRPGSELDFQLKLAFAGQQLPLNGRGVVRWVKKSEAGPVFAGVEIVFLTPESKLLFGAWLNVRRPVSYIPRTV